jgi:hypothetical protein
MKVTRNLFNALQINMKVQQWVSEYIYKHWRENNDTGKANREINWQIHLNLKLYHAVKELLWNVVVWRQFKVQMRHTLNEYSAETWPIQVIIWNVYEHYP